jgi:tetraacyldisaccharide 4'-kinase
MRILRWLLAPLAPLYGLVVRARNRAFDLHPERAARVDVPVVSIGNLTLGGTGKTPLTLFLAQELESLGHGSIVLSRGYGGRRAVDPMDVAPDSDPGEVGDEPLMMARRLGPGRVVVGRRRHAAALRALSREPRPRVLLLDDGFQHRALARDLDLLVLDGVRTWGNGRMLPLGDLREPMASAHRAQALVVTRGRRADRDRVEAWWQRHGSGGPTFYVDFSLQALRDLRTGRRIPLPCPDFTPLFPFCALGHPEAFYADLLVAGLRWTAYHSLPDHASLRPGQLEALTEMARRAGAEALVCTEKDAVKLGAAHLARCPLPLYAAEQAVQGGEALLAFVARKIDPTSG